MQCSGSQTSKREMTSVEIPKNFLWVYEYWKRWWDECLTGQFIYDFQDGGIKNIREQICHKPNKTKNSA